MTFEAYMTAVKDKTGKDPDGLKAEAEESGVYRPEMTATELVEWLAERYGLGRGHAMSVWAVWKARGWVSAPK